MYEENSAELFREFRKQQITCALRERAVLARGMAKELRRKPLYAVNLCTPGWGKLRHWLWRMLLPREQRTESFWDDRAAVFESALTDIENGGTAFKYVDLLHN